MKDPIPQRVSANAVRAQLGRILASEHFARSERLSRFLEFTVEQTLAGRAELLKEYPIGVEVFGRKDSFDPRIDAIVRVQAVSLRSRVHDYYAKQGVSDPIVIEYSKGGYAPVMHDRSTAEAGLASAEQASIAVLPFVNLSPDPEYEYFSDGLTEELISALTNVKGLRVVARTSVFQFKGKAEDVRKIGAQLNARGPTSPSTALRTWCSGFLVFSVASRRVRWNGPKRWPPQPSSFGWATTTRSDQPRMGMLHY